MDIYLWISPIVGENRLRNSEISSGKFLAKIENNLESRLINNTTQKLDSGVECDPDTLTE